jgi:hypothetical protein
MAAAAIVAAPAAVVAAERLAEAENAPYSLLKIQMGQHLAELKSTRSTEDKIAKKLEFLPLYQDHIDTVLATSEAEGRAVQDEIFVQLMIWTFDAATINPELYGRALDMAEYVMRYGLTMPDRFNRGVAEFLLEAVAEDAAKKLAVAPADASAPFDLDVLKQAEAMTASADVLDVIKAKAQKAAAKLYVLMAAAIDKGETEAPAGGAKAARAEALKRYKRAFELDKNIGVKKEIEQLERLLKNAPPETAE